MSCFLTQDIKHTAGFSSGGITSIHLLDIRDFIGYKYKDDKLYDSCFVQSIVTTAKQYELDSIPECNFTEKQSNGIYKQELTTFIRSANAKKLSNLLVASQNKYLVTFQNNQKRSFTFGSDGGATFSFSVQTGQQTEIEGYSISLTKDSIYPLFEIDMSEVSKSPIWILNDGVWNGESVWIRDGIWKTI